MSESVDSLELGFVFVPDPKLEVRLKLGTPGMDDNLQISDSRAKLCESNVSIIFCGTHEGQVMVNV